MTEQNHRLSDSVLMGIHKIQHRLHDISLEKAKALSEGDYEVLGSLESEEFQLNEEKEMLETGTSIELTE